MRIFLLLGTVLLCSSCAGFKAIDRGDWRLVWADSAKRDAEAPRPRVGQPQVIPDPGVVGRAIEIVRLSHRVKKATGATEMAALWLKPYMKPQRLRAGRILFRKGDHANKLFLLTEGELEVVEFGTHIRPGRIFGEIALFSPEHVRTGTVRALSNCTLLWIHESTVRQLYYQNPKLGFYFMRLVVARLVAASGIE